MTLGSPKLTDAIAKKTIGTHALELQNKGPMDTNAIELQKEIHKGSNSKKSYEEEVWECVERGFHDSQIKKDFFIVVLNKKERHLKNILRQYFFYRQSCPTPEFDQTVYHIRRMGRKIKYVWNIPDVATCRWLPLRKNDLPEDQLPLIDMIEKFQSGELEKVAKRFNDEFILI